MAVSSILASLLWSAATLGPAPADDAPKPAEPLPDEAAAPLQDPARESQTVVRPYHAPLRNTGPRTRFPSSGGHTPLEGPGQAARARPATLTEPLERPASSAMTTEPTWPLGSGPEPEPEPLLDPATIRMLRLDYLLGVSWRVEPFDVAMSTSVEYGQMQGFSGSFHAGVLVSPDRGFVEVVDVPLGVGGLYRRRLGSRPLYASVGLTGGILVHRAATNLGVVHRVDPDFRLPLRFAWTVGGIGASVALVPGFSVRERSYERRGILVWNHHSVRVSLLFGLHWDRVVGRGSPGRSKRRRGG